MSTNGQVILRSLDSWHHSHTCYVCQKLYNCSWNFCQHQINRACPECIEHWQEQAKENK